MTPEYPCHECWAFLTIAVVCIAALATIFAFIH